MLKAMEKSDQGKKLKHLVSVKFGGFSEMSEQESSAFNFAGCFFLKK